jgi:hypothetical protein
VSPIPEHSPYKAGDRVQMHGYPGYPGSPRDHGRTGFRGVVRAFIGATILTGTTDEGRPWAEYWGALSPDGQPVDPWDHCSCCAAARQQMKAVTLW